MKKGNYGETYKTKGYHVSSSYSFFLGRKGKKISGTEGERESEKRRRYRRGESEGKGDKENSEKKKGKDKKRLRGGVFLSSFNNNLFFLKKKKNQKNKRNLEYKCGGRFSLFPPLFFLSLIRKFLDSFALFTIFCREQLCFFYSNAKQIDLKITDNFQLKICTKILINN